MAAGQARRAGQEGGGAGSASGGGVRGLRGMAARVGRERASEKRVRVRVWLCRSNGCKELHESQTLEDVK